MLRQALLKTNAISSATGGDPVLWWLINLKVPPLTRYVEFRMFWLRFLHAHWRAEVLEKNFNQEDGHVNTGDWVSLLCVSGQPTTSDR